MATDAQSKALGDLQVERRRLIANHIHANFKAFLTLAELEGNVKLIKALHKLNANSTVRFAVEP